MISRATWKPALESRGRKHRPQEGQAKHSSTRRSPRPISYIYFWLGRPIIQYPQDIVAFQELVWQIRPDVIVETGIAHGGSLILSASLLSLIDLCEATEAGEMLDPSKPKRRVVRRRHRHPQGHNREAIEAHSHGAAHLDGPGLVGRSRRSVAQVRDLVGDAKRVMVCLDSNHTQ